MTKYVTYDCLHQSEKIVYVFILQQYDMAIVPCKLAKTRAKQEWAFHNDACENAREMRQKITHDDCTK